MEDLSSSEIGRDYRLDGEARALYHWDYRQKYWEVAAVLGPNKEITLSEAVKLKIVYALIANNQLDWNTFDLRGCDREVVGGITFPGKSCHIDFTVSDQVDPRLVQMGVICDAVFGRDSRRTDHLYIAQPEDLFKAGLRPFWLPLPNHPLHVRLVHCLQIENPSLRDIGRKEKEAIAGVWKKIV